MHATIDAIPLDAPRLLELNLLNLLVRAADWLMSIGRGGVASAAYTEGLRKGMGPNPWCIDEIAIDDGVLRFRGWALPPGDDPGRVEVRVDGAAVDELQYGLPRPDIARI